jgi:hypothetical protein
VILDNSIKLEAVLAAVVAANQPEFHVDYSVWNVAGAITRPEPARGALNSTTDVTMLAAETTQGARRTIEYLSIYNKDTAAVTVIVKTDDGSTERILIKYVLPSEKSLIWEKTGGWYQTA